MEVYLYKCYAGYYICNTAFRNRFVSTRPYQSEATARATAWEMARTWQTGQRRMRIVEGR